ncbi:MAG: bifunctional ornithine acetyltransferase/N-acetylglutamate synthase, partial [Candidatus Wukongarchaeota archaeon]|nr:bifunctional ornithine acetyltransferase/N-acetylglutamate synthase [Candidatus Wukongarchaeota archaeon]
GGMAKGAGMIGPNLVIPHATMFAIIGTDAKINVKTLKLYASKAIDETFNMVAVDGDMSPNDTVIVFSTGKVGSKSGEGVSESQVFQEALTKVMRGLVKMIAKDGEGATKYVEVRIEEAESKEDAKKAALAVIKSPLVKCAIFGCDPNWGRVISAIGATGIKISVKKLSLWISSKTGEEVKLLENGRPVAVIGSNQAEKARQVLYEDEIIFRAVLGTGTEKATAYGCDMSYDYVKINAEYTT